MRTNHMKALHSTAHTAARRGLYLLLSAVLVLAATGPTLAQTETLKSIVQGFDAYRSKALQEKLYLHLDRPFYACGETMWFKVYNTDGTLHKPLDLSKVAYVEVLDESLKPVLQGKIALKDGTGNGSFTLPVSLTSGNYKVRAYTSWMKNFEPDFYFETPVTVVNSFTSLGLPPVQDSATYAIQFFPEGGSLVQGISGKVAFQGVNRKTGKGIDFTGKVVDDNGVEVAQFRSHKFGIGQFTFIPVAAATYTALIELPNRKVLRQRLPQVYEQGYSLHLEEYNADQLQLTVAATGQQPEAVHLLGHARQIIGVAESARLQQGIATFVVDKSKLAEGVNHFTVFNSQKQPVCERLYFKRPTQKLQVDAKTDKDLYTTREKVTANLLTQAQEGQAVPANLSVSVYKLDSLQGESATDIYSYLWLTSDLKGTVEQPGYYFTTSGPEVDEAIDNLMLTHGWSRFRWEDVLPEQNTNYKFLPEYDGHFIRGKITDAETGAIAPNITTYLTAPGKHVRLYSATSNKDGLVQFQAKDFYGPKEIVVQSNFLKDSTYHFEVFSPFSDKYAAKPRPGLDIAEHLQQELTQRHIGVQVPYSYHEKHLNIYRAPGIDSTAFYGKADATYLLDDYVRFKVMEEVMREYVPGVQVRLRRGSFHFNVLDSPNSSLFHTNPLVLLDGVPVFDIDKIMAFDPRKVRKLEVFTSKYFHGPHVYTGLVSYTTYQGDLAGFQLDPRSLLMEYEGLQLQREFYAPSYDNEQQRQNRLPDFRNLLHWSPDVVTKADGKTALSFFTSDEAGKYMIVVQGMTKSGLTGSKAFTFEVRQQPL
ncbi:hypothetical protein DXT99_06755 [Pontibacter diazotrophicus]|uniref:Macroglobulin domain-containing protein n=1 Tax=Pontibacter diazotrophicus TaxID=1400979 RepID=A0A3D8LE19_9BACT|nr:hypothetical protein [Pontibacter diazotrophicus]RDV15709.1 hypothetical protein DXT99_06755 [Pontibacter diazotrophicus]